MIDATYGHTLEDAIEHGRGKLDAFDARPETSDQRRSGN